MHKMGSSANLGLDPKDETKPVIQYSRYFNPKFHTTVSYPSWDKIHLRPFPISIRSQLGAKALHAYGLVGKMDVQVPASQRDTVESIIQVVAAASPTSLNRVEKVKQSNRMQLWQSTFKWVTTDQC